MTIANVQAAIADVFTIMGDVFTEMCGNPLLLLFIGATFVGVGVRVFRTLRKGA